MMKTSFAIESKWMKSHQSYSGVWRTIKLKNFIEKSPLETIFTTIQPYFNCQDQSTSFQRERIEDWMPRGRNVMNLFEKLRTAFGYGEHDVNWISWRMDQIWYITYLMIYCQSLNPFHLDCLTSESRLLWKQIYRQMLLHHQNVLVKREILM